MHERLSQFLKTNTREPLNSLKLPFEPKEAAVLLLFITKGADDYLVLTKRSEDVEHHKGQICFPGGVYDDRDGSFWQTALRETREELGIEVSGISYTGALGQVITPTGYRVHPYVGRANGSFEWKPSPREITEVITVPFSHLLRDEVLSFETKTYFGQSYSDPVFTYRQHKIWGATARILVDLIRAWKMVA